MNRLAGFLGRRRRWVLVGWLAVLVLALPLASRQTEHLTGGGFDVPGSQSKAVSDSINGLRRAAAGIAVLLQAEPGATPARAPRRSAGSGGRSRARRRDAAAGGRPARPAALQRTGSAMLPLRSDRPRTR